VTLSALGIFSAAGAGGGALSDYELITTQILGTAASSITFSGLAAYASTYKHLQIRAVARDTNTAATIRNSVMTFNADTTSYYSHGLAGDGSSVTSAAISTSTAGYPMIYYSGGTSQIYGVGVIDILDAFSTTKNKTVRGLSGVGASGGLILLASFAYFDTQAISSIEFFSTGSQWAIGSRFSIYGIKG
jgi:hypothetical protein